MKDAEAFYLIGQRYYLKDSYLKAMIWFLKAAYYCNTAAQYYIGRMFDYGLDVPKCEIKALKWYHRSTALENNPISLRIKKLNSEGYYLDAMERGKTISA
jgi:TPR repeat protein